MRRTVRFAVIVAILATAAVRAGEATGEPPSNRLLPKVQRAVNALANQPVRVKCDLSDPNYSGLSAGPEIATIQVHPSTCQYANSFLYKRSRSYALRYYGDSASMADALHTLAHEAWHTRRGLARDAWTSESQAECYAQAKLVWFSLRLYRSFALARRIRSGSRAYFRSVAEQHPQYAC